MFQTEPIHALQSFASEGVTAFMLAITSLGYAYTLIPILVVIAFGIDFRRGFLLVQIVLWNALLTDFLKAAFALPRPEAVDSTLLQPGDDNPEVIPFERRGAPSFWAPLPADVVSYYRSLGEFSYGFPSGHCSVTTALWGSAALLFRERWLWMLSGSLIVLMPLSRMYLGRHFVAGVLGGTAVGAVVIGVAWKIALAARRFGKSGAALAALSPDSLRLLLYLVPPLLALLLPGIGLENVLRLAGIGLGLWLLTRGGLPVDEGTYGKRFLRVVLALALYSVAGPVLGGGLERAFGESALLEPLAEGVGTFALTWGTTALSYRLGLYERGEPGVGLLAADTFGS